jgi:hypothetical protein
MLHANPRLKEKGFLMVFNPTGKTVKKDIRISLYYTGLTGNALIRDKNAKVRTHRLDRDYNITIPVEIEAGEEAWFTIE